QFGHFGESPDAWEGMGGSRRFERVVAGIFMVVGIPSPINPGHNGRAPARRRAPGGGGIAEDGWPSPGLSRIQTARRHPWLTTGIRRRTSSPAGARATTVASS